MRRYEATFRIVARPDDERTCRVAEQDTAAAILPINDSAQQLGADNEHTLRLTGANELVGDAEPVERTGASGGNVEGTGPRRPKFGLHEHGAGGHRHVGRDGPDDDHIELGGIGRRHGERLFGCFDRHIGCRFAIGGDMAFLDAGALDDPGVRRINDFFEFLVGENARRSIRARPQYQGLRQCHHLLRRVRAGVFDAPVLDLLRR